MKVVNVNAFDLTGGAGKAAYRLHNELLNKKINSIFVVQRKLSNDFTVLSFNGFIYKIIQSLRWRFSSVPLFFYRKRLNIPFSTSFLTASGFANKINKLKPDIVHLHWISGGMMQIEELSKIKAPLVFSLHDCWPFTGGCHIIKDCEKFLNSCGHCPALNSKNIYDISRWVNKRKENTYNKKKIIFIGVSNWITDLAKRSSLLKNECITTIPNLINLNHFKIIDKSFCRDKLGISLNKKIILYGAYGALKDHNKGYQYFLNSLKYIDSENIEILIFGNEEKIGLINVPFKVTYLGIINSELQLNYIYSSADVMVVPSMQESFGQTAIEAMASGTPVVCFNTSGLKDIVDHKINGYRARCFQIVDLANGINWILNNDNIGDVQKLAREKVIKTFDSSLVVDRYIALYNSMINHKKR